jgi:DNA replicative helicase MCM subunit Mcm2 (Cdc46/Mcm family)
MDSRVEERLQLKRDFSDFLDADNGAGPYVSAINDLAQAAEQKGAALRLLVDMNDVLDHDPALHKKLLHRPAVCLPPFQEALEELLRWATPS